MDRRLDIPDARLAPPRESDHAGMAAARGIALNALFPPQPRLPSDMLALLGRLDRTN